MNKAKTLLRKASTSVTAFAAVGGYLLFGMPATAHAQVIPTFIQDVIDAVGPSEASATDYVNSRVRMGLTVLFVAVFLVAIAYSALAAIKFISSQGDSGKLEESKNAVKAILMGFAAMILAIVGIFVILVLLGSSSQPDNQFNFVIT